jgi:polar amino acid transport system substrate-binding protein
MKAGKRIFLIFFVVLLSACTPKSQSVLVVGIDEEFAPMTFRDEQGNLTGFDIEFADAVGSRLKVKMIFQPIDWDAMVEELNSGHIDCVWSGLSITEERKKNMLLSQYYLSNKNIVMCAPGVVVTAMEDLIGKRICTMKGTYTSEAAFSSDFIPLIKDNVTEFPSFDICVIEMQAGRQDVLIVDEAYGQYNNNKLSLGFVTAPLDLDDDYYLIGFRKTDVELCRKIEGAIKGLIVDGTGEAISRKWFGKNLLVEMQ